MNACPKCQLLFATQEGMQRHIDHNCSVPKRRINGFPFKGTKVEQERTGGFIDVLHPPMPNWDDVHTAWVELAKLLTAEKEALNEECNRYVELNSKQALLLCKYRKALEYDLEQECRACNGYLVARDALEVEE
jgi:hypothetical protein